MLLKLFVILFFITLTPYLKVASAITEDGVWLTNTVQELSVADGAGRNNEDEIWEPVDLF